jgi:hypothetical protein
MRPYSFSAPERVLPRVAALAVLIAGSLVFPLRAQGPLAAGRDTLAGLAGTRVLASSRQVRVIFPRDTARSWGWGWTAGSVYHQGYSWKMWLPYVEPKLWSVELRANGVEPRRFSSLASLVAAGTPVLCFTASFSCASREWAASEVTASVEDGQVVLTLRTRAHFGSPEWVQVGRAGPDSAHGYTTDSVRVEYVDP